MRSKHPTRFELVRSELPALWRLAWPVVLGELGWQTMSLVDTLVVGRVSAEALAGVAIGGALFFVLAIFGIGMLLGLDFAVARAVGANRADEVSLYLWHGVALAAVLGIVLTSLLVLAVPTIGMLGIDPGVASVARDYFSVLLWSLVPLLLFTALRRFLQAMGSVRIIAVAILLANVVNALADWALVLGNWGAPTLGAAGAAWATLASRLLMLAVLVGYLLVAHRSIVTARPSWNIDAIALLVRLGFPAALQLTLEVGVFATVTALAGRLGAVPLAAHHVVLNIASLSFMIPLGISAAAAVRVGQEIGRQDRHRAAVAGWTAILLAAVVMCGCGLVFISIPRTLVAIFSVDPAVVASGAMLLWVAAAFQLFDGVQVVATGALRGTGNTRAAMLTNLVAHWLIGLPVGVALGLWLGWGVVGLWGGLAVGLVVAAFVLLPYWRHRVTHGSVLLPGTNP